jgi:hypothetical protein
MDENAKIDSNNKSVAMAVTDDANKYRKMLRIDNTTKGLKVSLVGGNIPIVAGSDTMIQYNKGGILGATSNLEFDYTNNQLRVGLGTILDGSPTNPITLGGNVNSSLATYVQNKSSGNSASSDINAGNDADNGDPVTGHYVDMGINSSTYNDAGYTTGGANDTYLMGVGGNLAIGTATSGKIISFFTGGTLAANIGATLTGGALTLGLLNTTLGSLTLFGNTSGSVTIQPNAIAGSGIILTAPATTGTLALTSQIPSVSGYLKADGSVTGATGQTQVFTDTLQITALTASQILATDASKNLVSLAVASYPSLTELSYVKGVTSALQTQINAKQATISFGTGVQTALGVNIGSAGAPVLFNGALGTPSSGVATNITGLPAASVLAGTLGTGAYVMDTKLTVPQVINTANAIAASGNAATIPVTSRHNIVTNNSAATLTITLTTAGAVNMQMVVVQILDASAVAQTITWVNTENSTVTAPTTSNGSTTLPLTVGFIYNSTTSKWRCIASA